MKFLRAFYFCECNAKHELKMRENFNSNALTIKNVCSKHGILSTAILKKANSPTFGTAKISRFTVVK
jgi:hypothetical protein